MATWRIILDVNTAGAAPDGPTAVFIARGAHPSPRPSNEPRGALIVEVRDDAAWISQDGQSAPVALDAATWSAHGPWRVQACPMLDDRAASPSAQPDLLTPRLVLRSPAGEVREVVLSPAHDSGLVVGRRRGPADVTLDDRHVSARHFRVLRVNGRHALEDLDSRHGTFVNGVRVRGRRTLHHQDAITAGATRIDFIDLSDRVRRGEPVATGPEDAHETLTTAPPRPDLAPTPVDSAAASSARDGRARRATVVLVLLAFAVVAGLIWAWAFSEPARQTAP